MLGRKRSSDSTETGSDQRLRGRGLGPFTSGHLTAIIITFAVLVLFPVGAWATYTVSHVTITDNGGTNVAKVNRFGQLSVNATGSVTAAPAAPSAMFSKVVLDSQPGGLYCDLLSPPAGKAYVITSIDESVLGATSTAPVNVVIKAATASGCGGTVTDVALDEFTSVTPHTVAIASGVGIQSGHFLGVYVITPSGGGLNGVSVTGYSVPSTECSSGCL